MPECACEVEVHCMSSHCLTVMNPLHASSSEQDVRMQCALHACCVKREMHQRYTLHANSGELECQGAQQDEGALVMHCIAHAGSTAWGGQVRPQAATLGAWSRLAVWLLCGLVLQRLYSTAMWLFIPHTADAG